MRLRFRSRGIARLLLFVWMTAAVLPALRAHGSIGEDAACGPWEVLGRQGAAAVTDADTAAHADHCAICHLQRAARSALAATIIAGVAADPHHWASPTTAIGPRAAGSLQLPSRAPPLSRLQDI